MKARIITNQTPANRRSLLADQLPLETPYMVQIFPVYACNFKCNYCVLSLPKSTRGYISDEKFLDIDLYKKCINDIKYFPEKLRMLRFAGTGEPLLHPKIAEMVSIASQAGISDSIDIVTNGALLTPDLSKILINSGVSRIRVSIQGVKPDKYKETTGLYDDLDKIISNISFLYSIRDKCELYVKIIDSSLDSPAEEQQFYRLFGDIADVLSVEHLLPATPLIDYSHIAGTATMNQTQNGAQITQANICPQPFYMLQINPDGMIVPCCGMESPLKLAHLKDTAVTEVWKGHVLNLFRNKMLKGQRAENNVCRKCEQFRFAMFPEDVLDHNANQLVAAYPYVEGC